MTLTKFSMLISAVVGLTVGAFAQGVTLDPKLPTYTKASGPSGSLNSVGSDTLNNLMTLWAESFRELYPGVKIQVEGKGSSTAPTALIESTAQLGPMSRKMKDQEIDAFVKRFGYPPVEVPVAIDGLAVYVHKDNPIEKLTMQQVDALFSSTRKGGLKQSIETWGDAGLTGSWTTRGVSLFGRNSASGTYGYFKEYALYKGDFKDTVKEQPGSASVVQGVAEILGGVGYSGIGYRTSEVRALSLSKDGLTFFEPTPENVYAGKYPLSRFLYVYVNKAPNQPLNPTVREFLRFVLSKSGQEVVVKDGYLPLTGPMAERSLKAIGVGAGGTN